MPAHLKRSNNGLSLSATPREPLCRLPTSCRRATFFCPKPYSDLTCSAASGLAAETAKAEAKPARKITGQLEEGCSCRARCPCWFKAVPSRMTCDGVQIVFITKGKYGKTPLDGLAVAQFVQSPAGKSMFESFGDWNFDNVYIDDRANDDQRLALRELAGHLFPRPPRNANSITSPSTARSTATNTPSRWARRARSRAT